MIKGVFVPLKRRNPLHERPRRGESTRHRPDDASERIWYTNEDFHIGAETVSSQLISLPLRNTRLSLHVRLERRKERVLGQCRADVTERASNQFQ